MSEITVIDVLREAGVSNPPPVLSWAIGQEVARVWRSVSLGSAPRKELKAKTRGGGSHCFAVYPVAFRPVIRLVVEKHAGKIERQITLF